MLIETGIFGIQKRSLNQLRNPRQRNEDAELWRKVPERFIMIRVQEAGFSGLENL